MNKELENVPIGPLLIKYSIPALIGSVINLLYTIVDRIFIGQKLGSQALAGVTLTFPITNISFAVSAMIGVGASTIVAIKLGEKKFKDVTDIVGNQLLLFLISSAITIIILLLGLEKLLYATGGNEITVPYGLIYGKIIIPVLLFQCYTYGLNGVIRAFGYPRFIMITSSLGAILNILFDYIFLYPLDMGIFGVGFATFLSTFIAAIINVSFFLWKKCPIKLKKENFILKWNIYKNILKFGVPSTMITLGNAMVSGLFNKQLNILGGGHAIAAYGVYMTMHSFIIMMINGVSHGGMPPIIGYNKGAKKYDRVLETVKLSMFYSLGISVIVLLTVLTFPEYIMRIFISDRKTIDLGVEALRFGFIASPFMISTIVISTFYQALGEAKLAMTFNFVRKVLFIIPCLWILPNSLGLKGIWLSRPIADTIALMIISAYFIKTIKEFRKKYIL